MVNAHRQLIRTVNLELVKGERELINNLLSKYGSDKGIRLWLSKRQLKLNYKEAGIKEAEAMAQAGR